MFERGSVGAQPCVIAIVNPMTMIRTLLCFTVILCSTLLSAQTYFYIDQIVVDPQPATTEDDINIDLVGGLASTGAYVASASAQVTGTIVTITISAADPGGLTVIVPHTETVNVGQLPAGNCTIVFNAQGVGDFAPSPQHQFVVSGGGTACDSLEIASIQWYAFTDTAIVVHVLNENMSEIFDYPNFILFDANGDTLAKELVNFFGIGEESWHVLRIHPDATIPNAPFNGTLELWTLFTEELACSWEIPIDLCPPPACATLIPTIGNFGGALAIGTYSWSISDENFQVVATGQFEMTDQVQYDSDTICLPPGSYYMAASMDQPPTGGQPRYGVSTEGFITGPSQDVPWDLPVLMPFEFYLPCDEGTNGIGAFDPNTGLMLVQEGAMLRVQRRDGSPIGKIDLLDAQGRLHYTGSSTASAAMIPLSGIGGGLCIVRTEHTVQRVVVLVP